MRKRERKREEERKREKKRDEREKKREKRERKATVGAIKNRLCSKPQDQSIQAEGVERAGAW